MIVIPPALHSNARDLYAGSGKQFPLIMSVILSQQEGVIIADTLAAPSVAVVIHNAGFAMVMGNASNQTFFDQFIVELINKEIIEPSYILSYEMPRVLVNRIEKETFRQLRKRRRVRFTYPLERYSGSIYQPNRNIEFFAINHETFEEIRSLGTNILGKFWKTASHFRTMGFGYGCRYNGVLAGVCYTAAHSDNKAEIDVFVDERFRGRGLATQIVRQFIDECQRRHATPMWDAFEENSASIELAIKCGFEVDYSYDFYSFNIPLKKLSECT